MRRRRFLGLCGVAGVGGLTGLTLYDDGVAAGAPTFPRSADGHPALDDDREGWSVLERDDRRVSASRYGVEVSADVYTTLFAHDAARDRLAERTEGAFDRSVVLASLTRVDLEGYVNAALTVDRLEAQVLPAVESQLTARGVADVDYEATDLADDLEGVQRTYEAAGTMAIPGGSFDHPELGPVTVAGVDVPVEGVVALWKADTATMYVLGGVYPAEPVSTTATGTVKGSDGDRREVTRELDLAFDAAAARDAVLSLLD